MSNCVSFVCLFMCWYACVCIFFRLLDAVVTGTMVEVVGAVVEPVWGLWHGMVLVSS